MYSSCEIVESKFVKIPNGTLCVVPLGSVACYSYGAALRYLLHEDEENLTVFRGSAKTADDNQIILKKERDHWSALTVIPRLRALRFSETYTFEKHKFVPIKLCQATTLAELATTTIPCGLQNILTFIHRDLLILITEYIITYRVPSNYIFLSEQSEKAYLPYDTRLDIGDLEDKTWASISYSHNSYHLQVLPGTSLRKHFGISESAIPCKLFVRKT